MKKGRSENPEDTVSRPFFTSSGNGWARPSFEQMPRHSCEAKNARIFSSDWPFPAPKASDGPEVWICGSVTCKVFPFRTPCTSLTTSLPEDAAQVK